jgi:hypothetical protein
MALSFRSLVPASWGLLFVLSTTVGCYFQTDVHGTPGISSTSEESKTSAADPQGSTDPKGGTDPSDPQDPSDPKDPAKDPHDPKDPHAPKDPPDEPWGDLCTDDRECGEPLRCIEGRCQLFVPECGDDLACGGANEACIFGKCIVQDDCGGCADGLECIDGACQDPPL